MLTTGGGDVYPAAINGSGQVVGDASGGPYGEYTSAFLYSGGTMQWLGGDTALGINDNGLIVGESYYSNVGHAIYWSGGGPAQEIPTGRAGANASAVNNGGQIVCQLYRPSFVFL